MPSSWPADDRPRLIALAHQPGAYAGLARPNVVPRSY